jgi:sugar phosphate isomerase/epimerase
MPDSPTPRFAIDLVTYYHPAFWGVATRDEMVALATRDPRAFWDRMLDAISASGLTGLEITFPPGHWRLAMRAYGGIAGFRDELARRDLQLATGFFSDVTFAEGDPLAPESIEVILRECAEFADFVRECGADIMVAGVPRRTRWARPPFFVDHDYAVRLADLFNRMGAITRDRGVRLALHTGVNSVMASARDVDLMMLLTDAEYVGLCPDTGHLVLAGADPVAVLERHAERVAIAHWKDATGPMPRDMEIDEEIYALQRQYFRRVGAGSIDWFAWARALSRLPRQPWILLEIDAVPDPVEQVSAAREFIEATLLPELYGRPAAQWQ